jgi:hypothetical protein
MPLDGAGRVRTADLPCSEQGTQAPGAPLLPRIEESQVLNDRGVVDSSVAQVLLPCRDKPSLVTGLTLVKIPICF